MKNNTSHNKGKPGLQWRGRLWLEGEEGTCSMEMSYKHAWDLLDSMNRQAGCKLVETSRGGKSGGGAKLTPAGERAIAVFWQYHAQFQDVLQEMTAKLGEVLGDAGKTEGCQGGT